MEFGQDIETGFNPLDLLGTLTGQTAQKERYDEMIKDMPYVYGRVTDFTPKVAQLNVFTNGEKSEEEGK